MFNKKWLVAILQLDFYGELIVNVVVIATLWFFGSVNSTCGTEPSHARTREEFDHPKAEYFRRGYEWWLMTEAKKRNPDIYLDCLEWGAPGWIGDGKYYSEDNIKYIVAFIKGAKQFIQKEKIMTLSGRTRY